MRTALSAVMIVCMAALPARSETILWKDVGDWTIRMDPSMGNACYVSTSYEDGTILRLGFNFLGNTGRLYFSLGNAKWKSLEVGKDYPIRIQFDKESPWEATASVIEIDTIRHLHLNTQNTNFAQEFSRKLGVSAYYAGKEITSLRLRGSSKAINEMLACQDVTSQLITKKNQKQKEEDPFAGDPQVKASDDPFEL